MTDKPKRRPGRPRIHTRPVQRIQIRATSEEVDRIYQLDTRRRAEVLLAECEAQGKPNDQEN